MMILCLLDDEYALCQENRRSYVVAPGRNWTENVVGTQVVLQNRGRRMYVEITDVNELPYIQILSFRRTE